MDIDDSGDSTYRGRPPSAKVAAVWYRVELSHLLKYHTQQENGTQRKENVFPYTKTEKLYIPRIYQTNEWRTEKKKNEAKEAQT